MTPSKILALPLLSMAFALALPGEADAEYRYLCTSIPSACEYTPSESAPTLAATVCWDGATATLMPVGGCSSSAWPYTVDFGEVIDPVTNEVQAYIPLDDACTAGYCLAWEPHDPGQSAPICCETSGTCYPGATCGGSLWWCHDGVSNADGTVECFEAEQL